MNEMLKNIDKNESIANLKAQLTVFIIILVNSLINTFTEILNKSDKKSVFVTILIILLGNIISYTVLYWVIDKLHSFFWLKVRHSNWNLKGDWYVIQIDNNKPHYFRVGNVHVTQRYYQIHMSAHTYNITYNSKSEDWKQNETSQKTDWSEDLVLSDDGKMAGLYFAERTNMAARIGFHRFTLEKYTEQCTEKCSNKEIENCKQLTGHISGWLCDVAYGDNNHNARNGQIILYRSYQKYYDEVLKFCKSICNKNSNILDNNGIFNSEI